MQPPRGQRPEAAAAWRWGEGPRTPGRTPPCRPPPPGPPHLRVARSNSAQCVRSGSGHDCTCARARTCTHAHAGPHSRMPRTHRCTRGAWGPARGTAGTPQSVVAAAPSTAREWALIGAAPCARGPTGGQGGGSAAVCGRCAVSARTQVGTRREGGACVRVLALPLPSCTAARPRRSHHRPASAACTSEPAGTLPRCRQHPVQAEGPGPCCCIARGGVAAGRAWQQRRQRSR